MLVSNQALSPLDLSFFRIKNAFLAKTHKEVYLYPKTQFYLIKSNNLPQY